MDWSFFQKHKKLTNLLLWSKTKTISFLVIKMPDPKPCGKKYNVKEVLATGSYGEVYLSERNGEKVAIKVSLTTILTDDNIREIDFLNRFKHPNVMSVIETYVTPEKTCLVMPFADIDFHDLMTRRRKGDDAFGGDKSAYYFLFKSVLCGLNYLHHNWVIHCDIKPKNILYSLKDFQPKITDFGLSVNFGPLPGPGQHLPNVTRSVPYDRNIFTTYWRPPEIFAIQNTYDLTNAPKKFLYGPEVDVYAISWVGMELLFDIPPPKVQEGVWSLEYLKLLGANPGSEFGGLNNLVGAKKMIEMIVVAKKGWDPYGPKSGYFDSFKGSGDSKIFFDILRDGICHPPKIRPTVSFILKKFPKKLLGTYLSGEDCESRIEYQAFKDLESASLKNNKCISFYSDELRETNIEGIRTFLKKAEGGYAGIVASNISLIELQAIDIMDRLYASFTSDLGKFPLRESTIDTGTLLFIASINLAVCLYSLDWEHEYYFWSYGTTYQKVLDAYNFLLPKLIEALDYKIYRPSLAHLGLSISKTLECYRNVMVPASYQAGEGECLI